MSDLLLLVFVFFVYKSQRQGKQGTCSSTIPASSFATVNWTDCCEGPDDLGSSGAAVIICLSLLGDGLWCVGCLLVVPLVAM